MAALFLLTSVLFPFAASASDAADARNLADLLILHPPARVDQQKGNWKTRHIAVGRAKIEVCVAQSPAAVAQHRVDAFVLEFTGNGNKAQDIVRWVADGIWKDRAVEVWAVNYPSFGGSSGSARLKHIGPMALAAYDSIRDVAGDRPIFVSGASFGGMTAIFVASRRPVEGVLVLNPPALDEVVRHHARKHPWLLPTAVVVLTELPQELDAISNARRCQAPLFAVVSQHDEVVPEAAQQLIYQAYAGPKSIVVMPGAGHNDDVTPEASHARGQWIEEASRRAGRRDR